MENTKIKGKGAMNKSVPPYARLYFDHLYSEYLVLKPAIKDPNVITLMEEIYQRRQKRDLTWANIYTFDLTLVDLRAPESLVRKASDARARYRSVAGQKEYDEYIASKPPDLTEIQFNPDAPPPSPIDLLRADIKYLLSKFYLYYALLPVREALRDDLTKKAVLATSGAVLLIALAIALNLGAIATLMPSIEQYQAVVVTVLTVTLAGIVGGCVSMLQRIQSAPSDGDALFNLAALTNGWRGILLSPLYGGIFASMLFVLFAGGILNGAVFPTIRTPAVATRQPAGYLPGTTTPAPSPTATVAPTDATKAQKTSSPDSSPQASGNTQKSGSPSPPSTVATTTSYSPTPGDAAKDQSKKTSSPEATSSIQTAAQKPESPGPSTGARNDVLQIKDFLIGTGPASGVSYSLLIVWSFLAGFAERLVPDTLNRLVAKNSAIQGGDS